MLHENGMKFFYFSDESPSSPPGNTRQFARAIEYSITTHYGTVPSTRLNIDSYLSWTIEWMIFFWKVVLKFDCVVRSYCVTIQKKQLQLFVQVHNMINFSAFYIKKWGFGLLSNFDLSHLCDLQLKVANQLTGFSENHIAFLRSGCGT